MTDNKLNCGKERVERKDRVKWPNPVSNDSKINEYQFGIWLQQVRLTGHHFISHMLCMTDGIESH